MFWIFWIADNDVLISWRWSHVLSVPWVFIIEGYRVLQRIHSPHSSDTAFSELYLENIFGALPSCPFSLLLPCLCRSTFFPLICCILSWVLPPPPHLPQAGPDTATTVYLLTHPSKYIRLAEQLLLALLCYEYYIGDLRLHHHPGNDNETANNSLGKGTGQFLKLCSTMGELRGKSPDDNVKWCCIEYVFLWGKGGLCFGTACV